MIELHLDKRVAISPTPITLRVGDQSIQHEEFVLYQNGDYYAIPENAKVMFEGNLYNGQLTSGECEILDRSKGKVKYTFSSGNASVEGAYKRAYLRVYKSDIELVSSENIRIIVLENADLDNGTAEAYENRLEKKLDEFDDKLLEVDSAVTTAKTDIAAKVEDVSIVGESAKTNITKRATETQAIAQTEQAKIQAELPKIQTELSAMNAEVAEAKVKVDELKAGVKLYTAYKMADGTFTTKYPRENLQKGSNTELVLENGTGPTVSKSLPYSVRGDAVAGKTVVVSAEVEARNLTVTGLGRFGFEMFLARTGGGPSYVGVWQSTTGLTNVEKKRIEAVINVPADVAPTSLYKAGIHIQVGGEYIRVAKPKVEIVDDGNTKATIYTPNSTEDPENAYPQYRGLALLPSDLPEDYVWEESAERIKQLAQQETAKLKGEVADIQNWIAQQGGTI